MASHGPSHHSRYRDASASHRRDGSMWPKRSCASLLLLIAPVPTWRANKFGDVGLLAPAVAIGSHFSYFLKPPLSRPSLKHAVCASDVFMPLIVYGNDLLMHHTKIWQGIWDIETLSWGAMACLFRSAAASFMRSSSKGTCLHSPIHKRRRVRRNVEPWSGPKHAVLGVERNYDSGHGMALAKAWSHFSICFRPPHLPSPKYFLDKLPNQFFVVMLKVGRILVGQCFGRQNETMNRYKQHLSIPSRIQIIQDTNCQTELFKQSPAIQWPHGS